MRSEVGMSFYRITKILLLWPVNWFDERFGIREFIRNNVTQKMIPKGMNWFGCFGGMALIAFLMQIGSGIFLALYYSPSAGKAFSSVQYIRHSVPYGWLIQKIHVVSPHVIIGFVICHMIRIVVKGAYRKPRELHWVSGAAMLILTFLICYTGSILPANELSYWGINSAGGMLNSPTMAASYDAGFLRNGSKFSDQKFTVIYIAHIIGIPLVIAGLMVMHFAMVRKTGIDEPF